MKLARQLFLFGGIAWAQTEYISATIDGQLVSWVFSVGPATATPLTTTTQSATSSSSAQASSSTSSSLSTTSTRSSSTTQSSSSSSSATTSSTTTSSPLTTSSATTSSSSTSSLTTSSSSSSSFPVSTTSTSTTSPPSTPSSSVGLSTTSPALTISEAAGTLPTTSSTPDTAHSSSPSSSTLLKIILSIVCSILVVILFAIALFLCLRRRRRQSRATSSAAFRPIDQEKNYRETAYMPHSQPTLPQLHTPGVSQSQLYMPAPAAPPHPAHFRNDSFDAFSPIEPDHASNPFISSSERLGQFGRGSVQRGSYQPLTMHPTLGGVVALNQSRKGASATELPVEDRPSVSALDSSNDQSRDSRPSSDDYSHGDLGLVAHSGRYTDHPQPGDTRYPSSARPEAGVKQSPHPPSVMADPNRPFVPRRSSRRPDTFYLPSDERQSFDFGFGRPDSGMAQTGYRKSPNLRTRMLERQPMVGPAESEEEEAGTGGMVPLGVNVRTPPPASGIVGSLRKDSISDRLGSLRRSASTRKTSIGSGSPRANSGRFSITRKPVNGGAGD